ncbi:hypothetical protein EZS27_011756 [termite gut metagenome]|uniref:DUF3945 domain-containing protein n=1 Tax=termite gut metagenome TaxID=433724 RepID=A0A5J4S576_9ZZZZ
MDEKLKDQDVLLVKEKNSNELKAVSGQNADGTPKTTPLKAENNPDFLKIDKHGNVLENFFANFMRQTKEPTRFEFFKAPLEKVEEVARKLQEAFTNPNKPENREMLDMHRVEPKEHTWAQEQPQTQTQSSNHAIDENRIDWKQLEQLGISRETLEKTGSLDAMLNWQKSPVLLPITAKFNDMTLRTDARLSFRETTEGKLSPVIHALHHEPELDKYYFGMKFTDQDRENLLKTGNLGRIADVQYKQGETTPVFISIDKLTNEVVSVRAEKIKIPESIKGVRLDDKQRQALSEGKPVFVEGMTSKNGKEFSASIQVNAEKRGIEFRFDTDKKLGQTQRGQRQAETGEVRIPKTLLGTELSDKQRENLKAGQTVYVSGMKDKKGQEFNAYVKVNTEKSKLEFLKWNPDKAQRQGAEITPDNASKTQVAVNSQGKTNEATKNVKEPLKQGQIQPTEKQKRQQNNQRKSQGISM